ncbi:MAG: GDSL-type esterase/lipase family protein [Candidatus Brocadiia bacterium]|jgi:lysophospholipase L1-like esterase
MITLHEKPWLKKNETLVCLGDSLTAPKDGFVALLAKALKPLKIRVINAGLGGDKTPQTLVRLRQDVIARKPDALSIFLGTNDGVIGRGRWADEPRVTPEAYRCNLVWIIYMCRLNGIKKFSITPPMFYEGGLWTEFGEPFGLYRLAAREAADEMGARLVPADVAFQQEWQKHPGHTGLLLTDDGAHLNAAGHRLVADASLKAWKMA